jgi:heme/copper-type cytochrome/quinol oxidase subunit 2
MRGTVIVHNTQAEFDTWLKEQTPDYVTNFAPKPAAAAKDSTATPTITTDTAKKITMK